MARRSRRRSKVSRKSRKRSRSRRSRSRSRRRSRSRQRGGSNCGLQGSEINQAPMIQNQAPQEEAPQEPVQEGGRRKRKSRSQSGGKRKMNAYMVAKEKARKGGAASFNYKGTTYHKKKTKTGMVIYSKKK